MYKKLKESRAAKSGVLRDLSDCELMIPGIGHDKISDITINIIRQKLVGFTELQCRLHRIPSRLASISTVGFFASQLDPVQSETACFQGFA